VATIALTAVGASPGHALTRRHAHHFTGTPTVGAFFYGAVGGLHFCTASVIRSRGHDVILTAAHCMFTGNGRGYSFAPGYHDGKTPYGVWHTTAAYASAKWIKRDGDTRRDFVFLTVAPKLINGHRRELQDVVGGNRLGVAATAGESVRIVGYPLGVGGRPIACTTTVYLHQGYPGSHCHGFADGTSGGPWLAGQGRIRTVVGLISGLHQGGCTPLKVFSSPLGAPARAAFERAEHHRHPDSFPPRPSDGCASGQ
jgi:V8-like Glu-specific endopeptidase